MDKISEVIKFFNKQYKMQSENNRTNKKLKKYYTETKKDMRSNTAKVLDYIGIRIIVFFSIVSLTLIQYQNIYLSLISALICTSLFHIIEIIVRNKKVRKIIYNRRKYFASQKVYKELMSKGASEFEDYMKIVLKQSSFIINHFKQMNERNLLMFATLKNTDFLILCKRYTYDTGVPLKEIEDFTALMRNESYRNGIVISTSDFTQECLDYLEQNSINEKITLLDKDKLLKIIDKAGLFPTVKEIDEYTVDKIEKKEKKLVEYKELFLAQNKTKSYIFLALLLIIWTKYTVFQLYYFLIAMILLGLACITCYSNFKKNNERIKDFTFDEILDRK